MTSPRDTRRAWAIWQAGRRPDPQHPYLVNHRIARMQLRQSRQGALILPLCVRGAFQGVRLIPWDITKPSVTVGGAPIGCSVPTARYQQGLPLAVTVDWPSAVALHHMGLTAWACLSLDNLGPVAFQARRLIGSSGRLVVAGDNTEEGGRQADMVAISRGAELMTPGRPIGAPKWVETFGDLARWKAGVRRATA